VCCGGGNGKFSEISFRLREVFRVKMLHRSCSPDAQNTFDMLRPGCFDLLRSFFGLYVIA
jgi:hypothetical protein